MHAVAAEDGDEGCEGGKAPDDQHEVGLRRDHGGVERDERHDEEEDHHDRNHKSKDARRLRAPVAVPARRLERRRRGVGVGHRRAEDGDVHDDADDRPPERHHEGRQRRDGEHGVARGAVGVPSPQERRQRAVVRHRRRQAAHRDGVADEVREDGADERQADEEHARLAEVAAGHVECVEVRLAPRAGQAGHGAGPARGRGVAEREHRNGRKKGVGDHGRGERGKHDAEGLPRGEAEFRR